MGQPRRWRKTKTTWTRSGFEDGSSKKEEYTMAKLTVRTVDQLDSIDADGVK